MNRRVWKIASSFTASEKMTHVSQSWRMTQYTAHMDRYTEYRMSAGKSEGKRCSRYFENWP
jgi:hypothetical protein